MKILIGGSTGFIGESLVPFLQDRGHEVYRLVREGPLDEHHIKFDPKKGEIDIEKIEGFDVVINLCGDNVANARWTKEKKERIFTSRVETTRFLSKTLSSLTHPPKLLMNASAIGYYGNTGEDLIQEGSEAGSGFLASVCEAWEEATKEAELKGIRVAHLRFGLVLSTKGGALARLLLPYKCGLGGVIGSGSQYMSWIAMDDVLGAIQQIINEESLKGPVNIVAPYPVTNHEFTKTLGGELKRPTFLSLPAFLAKLIFGKEPAEEMLLASCRVKPLKLLESGYKFIYPRLDEALHHLVA
jgi:uncharacterized protein (TIGR01777 family)